MTERNIKQKKEMKEQYVTFETAKLLSENGFTWKCRSYYLSDGQRYEHCHQEVLPKDETVYACPTQAVAMRWLREEHRIAVSPIPYRYPSKWECMLVYLGRSAEKDDKYDICLLEKISPSYEAAAEAGICHVVNKIVAEVRKELAKKENQDE